MYKGEGQRKTPNKVLADRAPGIEFAGNNSTRTPERKKSPPKQQSVKWNDTYTHNQPDRDLAKFNNQSLSGIDFSGRRDRDRSPEDLNFTLSSRSARDSPKKQIYADEDASNSTFLNLDSSFKGKESRETSSFPTSLHPPGRSVCPSTHTPPPTHSHLHLKYDVDGHLTFFPYSAELECSESELSSCTNLVVKIQ